LVELTWYGHRKRGDVTRKRLKTGKRALTHQGGGSAAKKHWDKPHHMLTPGPYQPIPPGSGAKQAGTKQRPKLDNTPLEGKMMAFSAEEKTTGIPWLGAAR